MNEPSNGNAPINTGSVNGNSNSNNNDSSSSLEVIFKQTCNALTAFYTPSNTADFNSANTFLNNHLPRQQCCWQICTAMLVDNDNSSNNSNNNNNNFSFNFQFFAANLLKQKIRRNLDELPTEHHQSIYELLINCLKKYQNMAAQDTQYRAIVQQLSISVCLIIIQHPEWANSIQQLIDTLAKSETLIFLQILTNLAEEIHDFQIPKPKRYQLLARAMLEKNSVQVLKLLHSMFEAIVKTNLNSNPNNSNHNSEENNNNTNANTNNNHIQIQQKIFKCFAEWLEFMSDVFADYILNYSSLTNLCFQSLNNPTLFNVAVSCISRIIRLDHTVKKMLFSTNGNKEYSSSSSDSNVSSSDDQERRQNQNQNQNQNNPSQNQKQVKRQRKLEKKEFNKQLFERQFSMIVPNVINLQSLYEHALAENNTDLCFGLCRLFTETAEHYVLHIIEQSDENWSKQLLSILLLCYSHPNPRITSEITYFWNRFFRPFLNEVQHMKPDHSHNQNQNNSKHRNNEDFARVWSDRSQSYIKSLFPVIVEKTVNSAQYPLAWATDDMDDEILEDWYRHRNELTFIILDLAAIIGSRELVLALAVQLESLLLQNQNQNQNNNNNNNNSNSNPSSSLSSNWRAVEAICFCIQMVGSIRPQNGNTNGNEAQHPLQRIFARIPDLSRSQLNHEQVQQTVIKILGRHSVFVDPTNPKLFSDLLSYLIQCLTIDSLQENCLITIRYWCQDLHCDQLPTFYMQSLFEIYQKSFTATDNNSNNTNGNSNSNGSNNNNGSNNIIHVPIIHLNNANRLDLILAITECVSNFESLEYVSNALTLLIDIPYQSLQHYINKLQNNQQLTLEEIGSHSIDGISLYHALNCISTIFKHLKPLYYRIKRRQKVEQLLQSQSQSGAEAEAAEDETDGHIHIQMLEKLWPIFQILLNVFTANDEIMEKICRCIKHCIRECPRNFMHSGLWSQILCLMTNLYCKNQESQRSSFLYIIYIYVDEYFEKCPMNIKNDLLKALFKITDVTFRSIYDLETFVNNPELVEDYFELLKSYLKLSPAQFLLHPEFVQHVFCKAIFGLSCHNFEVLKAIKNFFYQFLWLGHNINDKDNDNQTQHQNNQNQHQNQNNRNLELIALKKAEDKKYTQMLDNIFQEAHNGQLLVHALINGLAGNTGREQAKYLADIFLEFYRFDKQVLKAYVKKELQQLQIECQEPSREEFLISFFKRGRTPAQRWRSSMDFFDACQRFHLQQF